jgi:hexosaminidase
MAGRSGVMPHARSSQRFLAVAVLLAAGCRMTRTESPRPDPVDFERPLRLVPDVRELAREPGGLVLPATVRIAVASKEDLRAGETLAEEIAEAGGQATVEVGGAGDIRLERGARDAALGDEGYAIEVDASRALVRASGGAGVFYGAQTVRQLITRAGSGALVIPALRIRDWPALRWRGVQDDVSRGPIPTLAYVKEQIRILAGFKINLYSLYFESVFDFAGHPLLAPPRGAITAAEVEEIVAWARLHHVTVLPQQQTFGHLHGALLQERYRDLAERPHGHVLAPGPAADAFVDQLLAELVPLFPGRFFHVGAAETLELGLGRSRERAAAEGLGKVYLAHLARLAARLEEDGKEMLFWGDIARHHPELLGALPRSAIAVAWNYDPLASFGHELEPFQRAGLRTFVAPGTSSWSQLFPNLPAAYVNIRNFLRDGEERGALGAIVATWDDDGDSLFDLTWPALVVGAACAWQGGAPPIEEIEDRYDWAFYRSDGHRFRDLLRQLASAHALLSAVKRGPSNDALWLDPFSREGARFRADALAPLGEVRLAAGRALEALRGSRPRSNAATIGALALAARRLDALGLKFQLAEETVRAYAEAHARAAAGDGAGVSAALREVSDIDGRLQDLRETFVELRAAHESLWSRENRPHYLGSVLVRYDRMALDIQGRINQVREARWRFRHEGTLPAPAELGFHEAAR